jgi:hypothetical protein
MKNSIRFLVGLILLIPICSFSPVTNVSHMALKPIPYPYSFAYTAKPDPSNPSVYDLTLYFVQLNLTTQSWVVTTCPAAVTITATTGPRIGTLTFPAGQSSVGLGNTTTLPASQYPITTNPTTINGQGVNQWAFELAQ